MPLSRSEREFELEEEERRKTVARLKCEIVNTTGAKCHRVSRYAVGISSTIPNIRNNGNRMYYVCGTHDKVIGRNNLIAQGWTIERAIRCESNPSMD